MLNQTILFPLVSQDFLAERLPAVFRITVFGHRALDDKGTECTACLYHEQASLRVVWLCHQPDQRLHPGALVSIRWQGRATSLDGCVRINRLVLLERPFPSLDLFDTVPLMWVPDRDLVKRADALVRPLPFVFKQLFNAIFWDDQSFYRFLVGFSSLTGHHNRRNGNFKYCVEVALPVWCPTMRSYVSLCSHWPACCMMLAKGMSTVSTTTAYSLICLCGVRYSAIN